MTHRVARGRTASAARPRAASGRVAGVLAAIALAGAALAHAYLDTSEPAGFETATDVETIVLRFTSDLEPAFSRFELVRLELDDDAWPAEPDAPTDTERMRLNALAARALTASDDAARVAVDVDPNRRTASVALSPEGPLAPGAYAVAYEVLAVDGHTTSGHFVFFVAAD